MKGMLLVRAFRISSIVLLVAFTILFSTSFGKVPSKSFSELPDKEGMELSRSSTGLEIHSARLKGRKLIVTGINFDGDAVVLVNGQVMKTIRDSDSSTTRLVAKKAGDAIPVDSIYIVSVMNSTGEQESLKNFRGSLINARVLPTRLEGYVHPHVYVDVGEYLLTRLSADLFDSAPVVRIDSNFLQRVTDVALPSTEYRLYRAIQSGVTRVEVVIYYGGEYPPLTYYFVLITIA